MPRLPSPLSPYQRHIQKWSDCKLCPLGETRGKIVFHRGSIPCDVLFIGEAPGPSEDALGKPFKGPAGHLLDEMIAKAEPGELRLGFTNLISCMPKDETLSKFEPPPESIEACSERLNEYVNLSRPRAIVLVGKHSKKYVCGQAQFGGRYAPPTDPTDQPDWIRFYEIIHPSAILQADISQKGLAIQKTIVTLYDAFRELEE